MRPDLPEIKARLRELELFHQCSDDDLDLVATVAGEEVQFDSGELLYEEGDPARDCYVIVDGETEITVSGRFLGSSGPGESVGEMGLLHHGPRTATVMARTPVTVQVIDARGFDHLLDEAPSVTRALLRQVSGRLAERSETIARLMKLAEVNTVDWEAAEPTAPIPRPDRIALDPQATGFFQNPYAQYATLREHEPVHYDAAQGTWLLTRYEDVLGFGRHKQLTVDMQYAQPGAYVEQENGRLARMEGRQTKMMFRRDPPDHSRLRRQVYRQFTPKAVKQLRSRVQQLVDGMLDRLAEKGEADLMRDFAFPLPLMVISEMLGVPRGDDALIHDWSNRITKALDPAVTGADIDSSIEAADAMDAYLRSVIEKKRARPENDLLSHLIAIAKDERELSVAELVDQVTMLYIAGHETTVNLIGNGTLALLRQRDQLESWRLDPAIGANALEELLRFDSPAQFTRRIALEDVEFGGRLLPAGSVIFACLGAANRDPAKWGPSADRLEIARRGANEHVSFGGGVHHCLGASLVRLEGSVAMGALVQRFPRMELLAEPTFGDRMALRGLTELRISLGS